MDNQLQIPEFVTPCLPGIQHEYYGNYHLQYSNVTSGLLVLTNESFFSAIKTGDLSLVKKFFPKFKNVINQIRTPSGLYPLHLATIKGHYEIVKYLVEEQNALVDIIDNEKETPLLKASYNGYKDIVNFLKKKNANINYRDREGWTALHNACSRGFCDIAQFLINSDADINSQNATGQTPLMIACSKGFLNIIQLLIMTNTNPLIKNKLGETAYDIAAQNSEYYICAILENYEKEYIKKNKLGKEKIVHNVAIEIIFENQRSSVLPLNSFSSDNLQKNDKCGAWSNKYGIPCTKENIKLPKSNNNNGWFWMTDWTVDLKSPNVNKKDGWQYAKTFEDKPECWSSEPIKGISSIVGCVRRRIWIRIRKRKYIAINNSNNDNLNCNSNNNIIASSSSSSNNNNNYTEINNSNINNNYNNGNSNNDINDENELLIKDNKTNIKGKNILQTDNSDDCIIEQNDDISDISQYLSNAKNIINEEEYSWEYLSKTETNINIIENQFNKYTEAIEYLLKMNKENNLSKSKKMSNQIESYLKKAEYLKEKLKRLKGTSPTDKIINSGINEKTDTQELSRSSSTESTGSPSTTQWEKDENAPHCNGCKGKFSLFNRRHHCRNCGKVFCSRCSDFQFKLNKESPPSRVCKKCYKNLTKFRLKSTDNNAGISENEDMINSSDDELIECPVCGKSLTFYGSDQNNIENHLKTCLDQVNNENKVKLGNRFELQKLDHDLGSECPICFEEFLKGQTIARIDCLCIFHKDCIDKWYDYRKVTGICPIHSMDD